MYGLKIEVLENLNSLQGKILKEDDMNILAAVNHYINLCHSAIQKRNAEYERDMRRPKPDDKSRYTVELQDIDDEDKLDLFLRKGIDMPIEKLNDIFGG